MKIYITVKNVRYVKRKVYIFTTINCFKQIVKYEWLQFKTLSEWIFTSIFCEMYHRLRIMNCFEHVKDNRGKHFIYCKWVNFQRFFYRNNYKWFEQIIMWRTTTFMVTNKMLEISFENNYHENNVQLIWIIKVPVIWINKINVQKLLRF